MSLLSLPKPKAPPGSSDEFFTPWPFFTPLHEEFRFTLDVCATPESAKLARYVTAEQDGLAQSWAGERVWCNPPYSDPAAWVCKAEAEMLAGCELVVMLLPGNRTEQSWWQWFIEPVRDGRGSPGPGIRVETRFVLKRIRFGWPGNPDGEGSGRFNSVLVIWRRR